jgi:hypothetical protein
MALFNGAGIDNVVAALALRKLGRRAEAGKVIASIKDTPNITRLPPAKLGAGDPRRPIRKGTRSPGLSQTLPDSPRLSWIPAIVSSGNGEDSSRTKRMRGKKFGVFSQGWLTQN